MKQKTIDLKELVTTVVSIAHSLKKELAYNDLDISDDTAVTLAMKIIDGLNLQGAYLPAILEALKGRTQNGLLKL